MGGIRVLHQIFVSKRRDMIDFNNPDAIIPDNYFKICAKFIPMLEVLREDNLISIYKEMIYACTPDQLGKFQSIPLEKIAKKIDYEKICNQGLYRKYELPTKDFEDLELEELNNIVGHCNDSVMKQYKANKGRPWAKTVSEDQLYQVF